MKHIIRTAALLFLAFILCSDDALAQRRGGGGMRGGGMRGGGMRGANISRGAARSSISRPRPASRPNYSRPSQPARAAVDRGTPRPSRPVADRPAVSQPIADRGDRTDIGGGNRVINSDREVNINRDFGGDYDYDHDGCCAHPIAAGVVAGAVIGAAASPGTVVYPYDPYWYDTYDSYDYTSPYADCETEVIDGITYQNCNGTWYQVQFSGTEPTYVVVAAPR